MTMALYRRLYVASGEKQARDKPAAAT